jgi:hypothetical protein
MKYFLLSIFMLLAILVISQIVVTNSTTKTKTVPYRVISKMDGFEIRKYPELIVAKTRLKSASYKSNSSDGFRKIASYIFGGNSSNQQISMTSPVQMEMTENFAMSFFMPLEFDLNNLPIPDRKDVIITTEPEKMVAALEFTGFATDEILNEKFEELKKMLALKNLRFENKYSYLGYNPPYQMLNRRNEIIIKLIEF